MSTFMANKGNIERKWYILDAANKPLGKTAAAAATLLRGKHKPEFTPNADCGDFVIIINAEKAVLTGKKLDQKYYRRHSGWIGGLKDAGAPRAGHAAGCQGDAAQEHHRQGRPHPSACLSRRRARARRPEARDLGRRVSRR